MRVSMFQADVEEKLHEEREWRDKYEKKWGLRFGVFFT